MRKWYLVPLLLLCLIVQSSIFACSDGDAGDPTNGDKTQKTSATTVVRQTTTTLSPATWEPLAPEGEYPEGRLGSSVYCDIDNGKLLLFGGWVDRSIYTNVLWSYDLASGAWTDIRPETALPAGRASHAWAYDPSADRLIVFGGYDGANYYDDTWAYDPVTNAWTDLMPPGESPLPRGRSAAVYVVTIDKFVLFGGSGLQEDPAGGFGTEVYFNDLWTFGKER